MQFYEIMLKGGPVMWIILVCSFVALFVFFEKTFQFHREEINVRELLHGLFNVLGRNGLVEAVTLCDNTPGPAARLLGAAITAYGRKDEDIQSAIDEAALEELPKLERHVKLLGIIAFILPLLGLFGTVLGLLSVFTSEVGSNLYLAGAYQALITTAAGLAVAIPAYLGYNYLVARVNTITLDMEKASMEILSFFERKCATENASDREA